MPRHTMRTKKKKEEDLRIKVLKKNTAPIPVKIIHQNGWEEAFSAEVMLDVKFQMATHLMITKIPNNGLIQLLPYKNIIEFGLVGLLVKIRMKDEKILFFNFKSKVVVLSALNKINMEFSEAMFSETPEDISPGSSSPSPSLPHRVEEVEEDHAVEQVPAEINGEYEPDEDL